MGWKDFKETEKSTRYGLIGLLQGKPVVARRKTGGISYEFHYISIEEYQSYAQWKDEEHQWYALFEKYKAAYIGYFGTDEFTQVDYSYFR